MPRTCTCELGHVCEPCRVEQETHWMGYYFDEQGEKVYPNLVSEDDERGPRGER